MTIESGKRPIPQKKTTQPAKSFDSKVLYAPYKLNRLTREQTIRMLEEKGRERDRTFAEHDKQDFHWRSEFNTERFVFTKK